MDERRVADYFVITGLPNEQELLDETNHNDGGNIKAPITDIGVIFPSLGEKLPEDYEMLSRTPTGLNADLNHGSLRTMECYLCIRRGRDKAPLMDIGVMYESKERLMPDAGIVKESVGGNIANVNNSTSQTFITYRRGQSKMPYNALVVTDICVVIASKGESPPHAFCCINKNLNKGIVGSDVFLCYKKSVNRAKLLTYKPAVLSRYPIKDLPHFPFPNSVPLFSLPVGATLELWPEEAIEPKPLFSTFVLTVSDAKHKVYGSAITFYEKFNEDKLTGKQRDLLDYNEGSGYVLRANKSICVLSHWPFSDDLEKWLRWLHSIVSSREPQSIPVERYIIQLLDEVPFPSPRVLLQMSSQSESDRIILMQPEDLPLPRSAASFKQLLLNLGSENCLQVLLLMLTEQKILIHSLRPDVLTSVAEAVSTMLFPFKWQCPYIPLCPLGLVEVLHAPLPFLIGVDSRFFDFYDPPSDVSCVDLDTNIITVAETQRQILNNKLLPKRPAKILKSSLDYLHYQIRINPVVSQDNADQDDIELEFQRRRREQAQELEIQEAFLRFMVLTLKDYRSYLLPITKAPTVGTTDPQALFRLNDFLKSRDKGYLKFFILLMKTQMFIRFIEERSFVADGDHGLAFFDDCMEKINNEDVTAFKLVELDIVQKSDRTVYILPPESSEKDYIYEEFILDNELLIIFGKKRSFLPSLFQPIIPGSPMVRRTKQEIKFAQKLARKSLRTPELWARCLCGTSHTLYFMILPSMLNLNPGKEKAILQQSYELLVKVTKQRLACDEVCYRLMMQLCAEHSRPLLAVKLLVLMKKYGIQPNALTYGLYNRCVLDAEWPAHSGSSQLLWNKLRNVVIGAAHFKWAAKRKASRRFSASTEGGSSLLDQMDRVASRSSLDSHEAVPEDYRIFEAFRRVASSIVRGSLNGLEQVGSSENVDNATSSEETLRTVVEHQKSNTEGAPEYRLLSRSESAGDANIIDKLQNGGIKSSSKSLLFSEGYTELGADENDDSLSKMSSRELVTENDPLGALEHQCTEIYTSQVQPDVIPTRDVSNLTDDPVLFKSSVHRSATFESSPPAQSKLQRSETVPAASVTSSLASLSSTFKLGFSPSSLTSKKSNELIQGGLSSIKSAATNMVKKMGEIKEVISTSTTSTPVKVLMIDRITGGDNDEVESIDGSDTGERHRRISWELGSYKDSCTNLKDYDDPLPENLFQTPKEEKVDCELEVHLTTCSQCHHCSCLLYDEDIMANWSAEDSNLNTLCQACNKSTVPFITIYANGSCIEHCDPFSVPYLNPLVLRKELENVLSQEGDLCLSNAKFVDEHPIIYWNLIWVSERINVQTHLPNLYLWNKVCHGNSGNKSNSENKDNESSNESALMKPVEEGTDPLTQELTALAQMVAQVSLKCHWDDPTLHKEGPPMYLLWKLRDTDQLTPIGRSFVTKTFMQQIINYIRVNDLVEPLKILANGREEDKMSHQCTSIYRDILFLACKALGRAQIDINAFDKEYTTAYYRIVERQKNFFPQDKPISLNSLYCRQFFRPLSLP